jgi:U5 small nuclear ribonucleoprotein component
VISVSISEEKAELEPVLSRLGVFLKRKEFELDIKPLVKLVLRNLLGDMACFVDVLTANLPHTRASTKNKVVRHY